MKVDHLDEAEKRIFGVFFIKKPCQINIQSKQLNLLMIHGIIVYKFLINNLHS
jgi:hypothetical protein